MYPPNWPRCTCGDYCLDGKSHCGRPECLGRDLRQAQDDWQRPARRDDGDDRDDDDGGE